MNYTIPRPPIQKAEDRERYYQYLKSPEWRKKCDAVFQRDKGICQGCLNEVIENTHHMTYVNLFDELLFQLVGLCECCHRKVHWIKETNQKVEHDFNY